MAAKYDLADDVDNMRRNQPRMATVTPDDFAQMARFTPEGMQNAGQGAAPDAPAAAAAPVDKVSEIHQMLSTSKPADIKQAAQKVEALHAEVSDPVTPKSEKMQQSIDDLRAKIANPASAELSKSDKIALGLLTVLPTLIGGVVGGAQGASIGADASQGSIQNVVAQAKGARETVQGQQAEQLKNLEAQQLEAQSNESKEGIEGQRAASSQEVAGAHERGETNRANIMANAHIAAAQISQGNKQDLVNNKDFEKFGKDLDESVASSRSGLGQLVATKISAQKVLANLNGRDLNKLAPAEIEEVARGVDKMLTGNSTVMGAKSLVPHDVAMTGAGIVQWLQSKPEGAQQKEFLEMFGQMAQRQITNADKEIQEFKAKKAQGYVHLKAKDPDRYADVLENQGLMESPETGKIVPRPPDPTREEAAKLLEQRRASRKGK